jgi:hypothetical protein
MFDRLKEQWKQFVALPSGRRFVTRNRLRRERASGLARKIVVISLGGIVLLVGVAMLVLPGPGILVMIIGAAFIAEESLIAARLLDRCDIWIARRIVRWRRYRATKAERHSDH